MLLFLRVLTAGFILLLCTFGVFAFLELQDMRHKQAQLAENQNLLGLAQAHAARRAGEHATEYREGLESLSAQINDLTLTSKRLESQLQTLQSKSKDAINLSHEQQKKISNLIERFDVAANVLLEEAELSRSLRYKEPKPFSYFSGPLWQHHITILVNQLVRAQAMQPLVDLAGGEDTFLLKGNGVFYIDGIFHKSVEIFKSDNDKKTTFFVKAPGLVNLENDRLTIMGSNGKDEVFLDGCLSWKEEENADKEFSIWRATDIEQQTRTVRITKNIQTQIQSTCDNQYLKAHQYHVLRSQLRGDGQKVKQDHSLRKTALPTDKEIKTATFGGIGIVLAADGYDTVPDTGIMLQEVMPEKPASKSGMQKNDIIIKVDGQPVAGMKIKSLLEKMRGPVGTSVRITFIRSGNPDEKEVTLVRETLQVPGWMLQPHEQAKSYLSWDTPVRETTRFLITPHTLERGEDVKAFRIKNAGLAAEKPLELRITKNKKARAFDVDNPEWEILPETACLSQPIPAGGECLVLVRAKPVMDGQLQGDLVFSDGSVEHTRTIEGYAMGIAGALPPRVVGNGSACPIDGTRAEVAISSAAPLKSNNGYFSLSKASPNSPLQAKLFTAECSAWKKIRRKEREGFHCNNPGEGAHTATLREYSGDSIDGEWKIEQEKERSISAFFTCRDGVIDWIQWWW